MTKEMSRGKPKPQVWSMGRTEHSTKRGSMRKTGSCEMRKPSLEMRPVGLGDRGAKGSTVAAQGRLLSFMGHNPQQPY